MTEIILPVREFMYTVDQIAYMLAVPEATVKGNYLHYEGRSVGVCPRDRMVAVDISPDDASKPDWRITEKHFKRWLRFRGWKIREKGFIMN